MIWGTDDVKWKYSISYYEDLILDFPSTYR